MIPLNKIGNDWTLFLDRDGVINHEKENDYIHTWDEFKFYKGAKEAFAIFALKFKRIIIITNQKGVGKGITKEADLHSIHKNMEIEIVKSKGRIDAVYFCADLDDSSPRRKPNAAMGQEAVKDFPDINLKKAMMVGNRSSDMEFGRNLGIYNIFIETTHPQTAVNNPLIDHSFPTLLSFAQALIK